MSGSPTPLRRVSSSRRSPSVTGQSGRRPSTPASASGSCEPSAGRTSTSTPASCASVALGSTRGRDRPEVPCRPADVPVPSVLHASLVEHRDLSGRDDGLVFGRSETRPFEPSSVNLRAKNAWAAAGLPSIGLHEARHTYASLMIAAGVNAKALSTYMGHSSVTITYDRYGHLMPGNEGQAAALLDAFLDRSAGTRTDGP
ncbi:MAG: site-specific integrase [Thermoleophilia bacterium]